MKLETRLTDLVAKLRGCSSGGPPRVDSTEMLWSWLGAGIGIGLLAWLGSARFGEQELPLLIGSFGASAVLVYGAPRSPLAQPRNLLGGHVLSALIGVLSWKLLHFAPWLAQSVAVATAIVLMHATRTLHPPGGATALIATLPAPQIQVLGWGYVLVPALAGSLLLLLVALVVNNLPVTRRYPEYWW